MEDFERQLSNALSRREPPPWLEAKILSAAQSAEYQPEPAVPFWRAPVMGLRRRWVSVAVAGCLVISGVAWQQDRAERERVAGLQAKESLTVALKVTGMKLRQIQQIVNAMERDN